MKQNDWIELLLTLKSLIIFKLWQNIHMNGTKLKKNSFPAELVYPCIFNISMAIIHTWNNIHYHFLSCHSVNDQHVNITPFIYFLCLCHFNRGRQP